MFIVFNVKINSCCCYCLFCDAYVNAEYVKKSQPSLEENRQQKNKNVKSMERKCVYQFENQSLNCFTITWLLPWNESFV